MCHALMFRDFSVQHSWNCMECCHHLICHFHLILRLTCCLREDFSVEINSLSSPDHLMPQSNLHLSQCLSVSPLDIKAFESGMCFISPQCVAWIRHKGILKGLIRQTQEAGSIVGSRLPHFHTVLVKLLNLSVTHFLQQ